MTATAPLDRLQPTDFYRQLDWIRDEWTTGDEYVMAQKLTRLRRCFEHLPSRYYEQASPLVIDLCAMRLQRDPPYYAQLRQLAELVRAWDNARPPLLHCPECDIQIRGHHALANHLLLVHDLEQVH